MNKLYIDCNNNCPGSSLLHAAVAGGSQVLGPMSINVVDFFARLLLLLGESTLVIMCCMYIVIF